MKRFRAGAKLKSASLVYVSRPQHFSRKRRRRRCALRHHFGVILGRPRQKAYRRPLFREFPEEERPYTNLTRLKTFVNLQSEVESLRLF
jgi:hypothetical protein